MQNIKGDIDGCAMPTQCGIEPGIFEENCWAKARRVSYFINPGLKAGAMNFVSSKILINNGYGHAVVFFNAYGLDDGGGNIGCF